MNNLFDIVILIGPNDIEQSNQQIEYTKKNIIGYRNIYLIPSNSSYTVDECITITEDKFPFTINTVAEYHGKRNRNGWYLQQLLKLYAGLVIPNILDRYLVIDSDTYFLRPTRFINDDNKCLYNFSNENHQPYYHHLNKLNPILKKVNHQSGICHHMIFETKYIKELFNLVENNHNNIEFYKIFLENVDENNYYASGASEYEIYFNYMLQFNNDKIVIRELNWKNVSNLNDIQNDIIFETRNNYDYISCHSHGIIHLTTSEHYKKMLKLVRKY